MKKARLITTVPKLQFLEQQPIKQEIAGTGDKTTGFGTSSIIRVFLLWGIIFLLTTCYDPSVYEGVLNEVYLFEKEIWGEWIRMDTGESWYFSSNYRTVENSFYDTPINMERESANVIKVTEGEGSGRNEYYLYASRVRNSTFSGSAVSDGSDSRSLAYLEMYVPKGSTALVGAVKNRSDSQEIEIGDNGEFLAPEIIPGDDYIVTIDGYSFPVTPNTPGENVGTLTLTGGVNIKTSVKPRNNNVDLMRLYTGNSYDLSIVLANISDDICYAATYEITLPEGITTTSGTTGIISSILPGTEGKVDFTIYCDAISEESEFKEIQIKTTSRERKIWEDSVSIKINRENVTFKVRSEGTISGVIIVPNIKTYHFRTSNYTYDSTVQKNVYYSDIDVPKLSGDYLIVFSGATIGSEARYAFAIDKDPGTNFFQFTDISKYYPNDTEASAVNVNPDETIEYFLVLHDINYFKVNFSGN